MIARLTEKPSSVIILTLKAHLFHKSFRESFWLQLDCFRGSSTWTGLSAHWRLFGLY